MAALPSGVEFEDCFKRFFTDKQDIIELVEILEEDIKPKENFVSRLKLSSIVVGTIVCLIILTGIIAVVCIKLNQSRKIN